MAIKLSILAKVRKYVRGACVSSRLLVALIHVVVAQRRSEQRVTHTGHVEGAIACQICSLGGQLPDLALMTTQG
jgi:hypothetical protein